MSVKINDRGFGKKMAENAKRFPMRMFKAYQAAARMAASRATRRVSGPRIPPGQRKSVHAEPRLEGWVLHVRTNTLRSSVGEVFRKKGKDIVAGVGAGRGNMKYPAIHELGLGKAKKRPYLKPSAEDAWKWLVEQFEDVTWDD